MWSRGLSPAPGSRRGRTDGKIIEVRSVHSSSERLRPRRRRSSDRVSALNLQDVRGGSSVRSNDSYPKRVDSGLVHLSGDVRNFSIRRLHVLVTDFVRNYVQVPPTVVTFSKPGSASNFRELIERVEETLSRFDLCVYQCFLIHCSTPSAVSVTAE